MAIKYLNNHDAYYFVAGQMGELHPMHWVPVPKFASWVKGTCMTREQHREVMIKLLRIARVHGIDYASMGEAQPMLDLYWAERAFGQCADEDAGGCLWRAYAAMFGYPYWRNGVAFNQPATVSA